MSVDGKFAMCAVAASVSCVNDRGDRSSGKEEEGQDVAPDQCCVSLKPKLLTKLLEPFFCAHSIGKHDYWNLLNLSWCCFI
jgi:hypothetical protein